MNDLRNVHRNIRNDFAELADLWNEVRGQWRDETAIQFEKEHWQPGERVIDDYLRALHNLVDILERAELEAGDI